MRALASTPCSSTQDPALLYPYNKLIDIKRHISGYSNPQKLSSSCPLTRKRIILLLVYRICNTAPQFGSLVAVIDRCPDYNVHCYSHQIKSFAWILPLNYILTAMETKANQQQWISLFGALTLLPGNIIHTSPSTIQPSIERSAVGCQGNFMFGSISKSSRIPVLKEFVAERKI